MFNIFGEAIKGVGGLISGIMKHQQEEKLSKERAKIKKQFDKDPNSFLTQNQKSDLLNIESDIDDANVDAQRNFANKGIDTSSIATQQGTQGQVQKAKALTNIKDNFIQNSYNDALNWATERYQPRQTLPNIFQQSTTDFTEILKNFSKNKG